MYKTNMYKYVLIIIYMSAPYASRCYSWTSLMAASYTEWHIDLLPRSMLFSGFLRSVAFLPQAFRSQPIGFHHSSPPTLLCTGAMRSGQLFSIHIMCTFTLGALHLHKCWITLCWYTKYPFKDNLPLLLLARKRDNRQSGTIDKVTTRQ